VLQRNITGIDTGKSATESWVRRTAITRLEITSTLSLHDCIRKHGALAVEIWMVQHGKGCTLFCLNAVKSLTFIKRFHFYYKRHSYTGRNVRLYLYWKLLQLLELTLHSYDFLILAVTSRNSHMRQTTGSGDHASWELQVPWVGWLARGKCPIPRLRGGQTGLVTHGRQPVCGKQSLNKIPGPPRHGLVACSCTIEVTHNPQKILHV
jgi:hypothetical protein